LFLLLRNDQSTLPLLNGKRHLLFQFAVHTSPKRTPHLFWRLSITCSWHRSRISRTQSGCISRAPGPDSPPTITQSTPRNSKLRSLPSKGSSERNFIRAPLSPLCKPIDALLEHLSERTASNRYGHYGMKSEAKMAKQIEHRKRSEIVSAVETCRRPKIPIRDYLCSTLPGLANFPVNRIAELTPSAWLARN
jgi:hypothetical protein